METALEKNGLGVLIKESLNKRVNLMLHATLSFGAASPLYAKTTLHMQYRLPGR